MPSVTVKLAVTLVRSEEVVSAVTCRTEKLSITVKNSKSKELYAPARGPLRWWAVFVVIVFLSSPDPRVGIASSAAMRLILELLRLILEFKF